MDDEALIEEEVALDARARAAALRRRQQDPATAAAAIPATNNGSQDETTALLDDAPTAAAAAPQPEWDNDKDFEGLPWWKRPSVYILLPTFALYTIAYGGVLVPKINLVKDLICRDYYTAQTTLHPDLHYAPVVYGSDDSQCRIPAVSGRSALFLMGDSILGGLLAAIVSPYLGDVSDRYGRKRLLIFTGVGAFVKEVLAILAVHNFQTFPVGLFFLGFIVDGLCGSFIAGMALAHCYATDCTHPSSRNIAFGFFQGVLFAGIGIGPVLVGLVIKATGSLLVAFYIALACHVFFVFNLVFVIPESLSKRRQLEAREHHRLAQSKLSLSDRKLRTRLKKSVTQFLRPLKILWPTGPGSSPLVRRNLVLLCAIDTTMFGVAMGAVAVLILYTGSTFGWGNLEQSEYVSVVNVVRVSCLFLLLPVLVRLLRGPPLRRLVSPNNGCDWVDLLIIRLAVLIDTASFVGYSLARSGTVFVVAGCIGAVGGIGSPTLASALTKHVPPEKTGQLLGASAMMHGFARLFAPVIFSVIYYATVGRCDQAVFVCLAVTFGLAAVFSWFLRPGVALEHTAEADDDPLTEDGEPITT